MLRTLFQAILIVVFFIVVLFLTNLFLLVWNLFG